LFKKSLRWRAGEAMQVLKKTGESYNKNSNKFIK
jgi:hypothetical protein